MGNSSTKKSSTKKESYLPVKKRPPMGIFIRYSPGVDECPCVCCGIEKITFQNFECGYIISKANGGGDELDNCVPICISCYADTGSKNLEEYKKERGYKTITHPPPLTDKFYKAGNDTYILTQMGSAILCGVPSVVLRNGEKTVFIEPEVQEDCVLHDVQPDVGKGYNELRGQTPDYKIFSSTMEDVD